MSICDYGASSAPGSVRLAGLAVCALLAAACHGGVDSPTAPSAPALEVLSATSDDDVSSGGAVVSARSAPATYEMVQVGLSGYSGTCSLAAARPGFRLKAQGQGTPGSLVRFHLIRADGFRTTGQDEVNRQGTFRIAQTLVTSFPPGVEVRCVLQTLDGEMLAESTTFHAP